MNLIDTVRLSRASGVAASALPFAFAAPHAAPASMDIVFIENFRGRTIIGIDDDELHTPQPVTMNLAIGVPSLRACHTDRIEDTVNYAAVRDALHALLATHGVKLLEALAEAVAQQLIDGFGAHWVRVQVAKPARFDDVDAVGVVIERRRDPVRAAYEGGYASLGEGLIPD
ncbi:dihydroneopterin aldolase [Paraburkholderia caballeronis]|uniref:dihydroneopterin aldolase n=1 Tax=Paraburkholderia caballeronis TaxID=416943 RepID=A0A1H7LPZ8_9BURK|nr:dihydroneopterin aldolase [Paraburkholderia caballeronis]PXW28534.1 dihydroneopterin aldolase [Paraburkholderia caballeronis]PXX03900.1 dihydroneopterin aldolase [Paraburkholderia caballeronis]RAK04644.1 dihydroneopterin aldolase [Paraburkholderia caballeronis]TDV19545.1 dihydroneopterin aldolase [Paraburkholderia caballeronis]TDV22145.1 dihydroneopterin aldolase [Paraburkholderia caballeronis]